MKVSTLYPDNPLRGNHIYIVGSGPSIHVLPPGFFRGEICVTLNDAWKIAPEAGPCAISNNRRFLKGCELPLQVCKGRLRFDPNPERDDNHTPWDSPDYYVFSYRSKKLGDPWDHLDDAALWKEPDFYWNVRDGSISIFAVQFAVLCGARKITLIGCDATTINGYEYSPSKHRGSRVKHVYSQYCVGLMRLVHEGWKRGFSLTSEVPYMGLGRHEEQFREMERWRK